MRDLRREASVALEAILDLVSFRSCLICEAHLGHAGPTLCRKCARDVLRERLVEPLRPAAFEMWPAQEAAGRIAGVWAAANYHGVVRDCIVRFKFCAWFPILPILTSLLSQRFRSVKQEFEPDVIVPVPAALLRFLYRGTNLPRALAKSLSARTAIPWSGRLRRLPIGRRQALKSKAERLSLSPSAFRVLLPQPLKGRKVLLVDDVLTTGCTALVCSQVLLKHGVGSVGILALAHG